MREILFRGKRKNNGEWVYGFYEQYLYALTLEESIILHYIINNGNATEVTPETVGQYTGMDDIDGKKIYEGDIVELDIEMPKQIGVVIYREDLASFMVKRISPYDNMHDLPISKYFKKIGNKWDNPELLEK